jgi:hypothetical protein
MLNLADIIICLSCSLAFIQLVSILLTFSLFNKGMGIGGSVDIRIYNENGGFCEILNLDAAGNQFQTGETDKYYGDDVQNCLFFYMPDTVVSKMTVQHWGSDAWKPEWFKVFTDLGRIVQCNDGNWIDGDEFHELLDCRIL